MRYRREQRSRKNWSRATFLQARSSRADEVKQIELFMASDNFSYRVPWQHYNNQRGGLSVVDMKVRSRNNTCGKKPVYLSHWWVVA